MASTYAFPAPAGRTFPIHRAPAAVVAFVAAIVLLAAGAAAALSLPPSAPVPLDSPARLLAPTPTTQAPR